MRKTNRPYSMNVVRSNTQMDKNKWTKNVVLFASKLNVPIAYIPSPPTVTLCHTFLYSLPTPTRGRRLWMLPKVFLHRPIILMFSPISLMFFILL